MSASSSGVLVNPVDAQKSRHEPAERGQEGEREVGFPLAATTIEASAAPVEDVPARSVQPVNKQAENGKPHNRDDEIGRPVDEGAAEGEEPDDREEDAEGGDDIRVDEAALVPGRSTLRDVQIVGCDSQDDGRKGQLRQAEDHGDEVRQNHFGGFGVELD